MNRLYRIVQLLKLSPVACAVFLCLFALMRPEMGQARGTFVWEDVSLGLATTDLKAVAILPNDPRVVFVAGSGMVFRTDDAGDSWRMILRIRGSAQNAEEIESEELEQDQSDERDERVEELFLQLREGIEDTYGSSYAESIELQLRAQAEAEVDAEMNAEQLNEASRRAETEELPEAQIDQRIRRLRVFPNRRDEVYACTEQGLYRSLNAGRSFHRLTTLGGATGRAVNDVQVLPDETLVIATDQGVVLYLNNGAPVESTMPSGRKPVRSVLWHSESGQIFAGSDEGILVSEDFGLTFKSLYVPMSARSRRVRDLISPAYLPNVIVASTDNGLLRSIDSGATFEQSFPATLGNSVIRRLSAPPERQMMLLATGRGLFRSADTGLSLVEMSSGLPDLDVRDVSSVSNGEDMVLWLATPNGVFRYVSAREVKLSRKVWLLLARFKASDPPLAQVMQLASQYAELESERGARMEHNLRWRSLAPRIRFEHRRAYERNENQLFPLDPVNPFLGQEISVVPGETDTRVEMSFELMNLVFDPAEWNVIEYREQAAKKRRRLRNRIARLYLSRQELLLRLLSSRSRGVTFRKRLNRLEARTALLDALTGYQLRWANPFDFMSRGPQKTRVVHEAPSLRPDSDS